MVALRLNKQPIVKTIVSLRYCLKKSNEPSSVTLYKLGEKAFNVTF